jgi:hypothetical protein
VVGGSACERVGVAETGDSLAEDRESSSWWAVIKILLLHLIYTDGIMILFSKQTPPDFITPALMLELIVHSVRCFTLHHIEVILAVTCVVEYQDIFGHSVVVPIPFIKDDISTGIIDHFSDIIKNTILIGITHELDRFHPAIIREKNNIVVCSDVVKKAIAHHEGAVVKTIGDAVMAVFRSASDGLRAMLEVQQELAEPADGSMPLVLKAGLNTGPCIAVTLNDRLDYFGSTVNLAARLESLSSGSDVVISGSVYEDAKVRELIETEGFSAVEFDHLLKGFEDERFELWRVKRG